MFTFNPSRIVSLLYAMQNGESHQPPSNATWGTRALRQLLSMVAQSARDYVACGPHRSQPDSRMVFALACNDVTRHDAVASVRAGFVGRELSQLWPAPGWQMREGLELPFTHFFATRRDAI